MADRRAERGGRKRKKRRRVPLSRRRLRLVWLVALLGVAAYLYYQPLSSYVETRGELEARRAEIDALQAVKAGLEQRLVSSTSLEATQREARRIGYVRPGERLYVVKGIPDWRMSRSSGRAGAGSAP